MIRPSVVALLVWWLSACESTTSPVTSSGTHAHSTTALASQAAPVVAVGEATSLASGSSASAKDHRVDEAALDDEHDKDGLGAATVDNGTTEIAPVRATVAQPRTTPSGVKAPSSTTAEGQRQVEQAATVVQGQSQTGEGFKTYMQVSSPLKLGSAGSVSVILEAQAPFKCNEQYPYRLSSIQGQGVTPSTDNLRDAQVNTRRTVLTLPVTATRAGRASLSGTFAFSVCTDEKCLIEKAALNVAFEVEP